MDINQSKILITGASRGLGRVISRYFMEQGAKICCVARDTSSLEKELAKISKQDSLRCFSKNLLKRSELQKCIDEATAFLKEVNIIIHCMGGGLGKNDDLISSDDLWEVFMTNLGVAAEINHQLVPQMKNGGRIIHIGSNAGYEASAGVAYGTSKAALTGYVRSLGKKLISKQVIVSGLLPAAIYAEGGAMWRYKTFNPEGYNDFVKNMPAGRMVEAEEILPLINILCNTDATIFAGSMIPVDAGVGQAFHTSIA